MIMVKGTFELALASDYCDSVKSTTWEDQMTTLCLGGGSSILAIVLVSINMLCAVLTFVAVWIQAKYSISSFSYSVDQRSDPTDCPPSYEDAMQEPSAPLPITTLDTTLQLEDGPPPYTEIEIM